LQLRTGRRCAFPDGHEHYRNAKCRSLDQYHQRGNQHERRARSDLSADLPTGEDDTNEVDAQAGEQDQLWCSALPIVKPAVDGIGLQQGLPHTGGPARLDQNHVTHPLLQVSACVTERRRIQLMKG
jgi:hypothetical protein